ncbi:hypothetical protein M1N19_03245, partial [Dehalococcoidia bacterium]|nr:hypothetical protein [Dehalococcoidia bacterium]
MRKVGRKRKQKRGIIDYRDGYSSPKARITLDSPGEGREMAEALKGITAELYEAMIAVVDERVKEIRVTREDFSELKGIVGG